MHAPLAWLQPCLHPVYARLLCAELRRRGFEQEQILSGTRLDWTDLHSNNRPLSFEQIRRLIVRALELSQCPSLGLSVGASTQLSTHGALGVAAMASPNVAQVLLLLQRFSSLRENLIDFAVEPGESLTLLLHERLSTAETHEYVCAHVVAGLFNLLQTFTGREVAALAKISWPFAEPVSAQAYQQFCPQLEFNASQLRIELPAELLGWPSLAADPDALRLALRDCEHQLKQQQSGSLSQRVQQRLLSCAGKYPTLEQMAASEHMAPRTLIRHLGSEGSNYQQLLDGVREELACWLLIHTPLSIEAIAERLGYQDSSNFSRTFRRWLGTTPRAFRDG